MSNIQYRLSRLEASTGLGKPRCPKCGKVILYHLVDLVDVHTDERLEHWFCNVCRIDAFTGRTVQEWEEGMDPIEGAIVASMPPGAMPALPSSVPIPKAITHWITSA